jgi:hypothetical protein
MLTRSRAFALIVSIALIAAALSPLVRRPDDDGFPLSTYPMFAWRRPQVLAMSYPLGVTAEGVERYLSPELIGSSEVLQAAAIVERAVARRGAEVARLCEAIARRVAASPAHRDVAAIRIVTGTHDAVELLVRDRSGREIEHGRCDVPRRGRP